MNITGRCHCGELEFSAVVNPEKTMICHCNDCQTLSASAFRTVVISELGALTFNKGTPKEYIKVAQSGNHRAQGFCENCGTGIYASPIGDGPKPYFLRVGAIDQRDSLIPKTQIWANAAQSWLGEIDSMRSFEEGPTQ
ncbi:GFA family protein [Paraglaciecola sp. L1A13]|uniref:GFA family protein n=1 Tax=Paraglaciecola sp. L1A13 TaxID=2686359 RepID=UPI00131E09BF|nr:GFA family protein [Paraglaciecola sp. L1A13]